MSEETNETSESVSIIDAEGNFAEGWRDMLDEDIRGEKCLDSVKNLKGAMKTLVHAHRMVGRDKIAIPGKNATEEEIDAYYKAGGRTWPETPQDYGFKRPDDFPEEHWDDEFMAKAQAVLHRHKASQELANDLLALNVESVQAALKAQIQAEEFELQMLNKNLDTEWGLARDQKIHLGNVAVMEAVKNKDGIVDEEYRARLLEKVNKDPDLIKMVSNLGSKFAEHGVVHDTMPTPGDIQSKINEEMAKDSYTNANHPNHANQVALVSRLFEEKAASTQTG